MTITKQGLKKAAAEALEWFGNIIGGGSFGMLAALVILDYTGYLTGPVPWEIVISIYAAGLVLWVFVLSVFFVSAVLAAALTAFYRWIRPKRSLA